MKQNSINNRFLLYLFVLSACLFFIISNVSAQLMSNSYQVSDLDSYPNMTYSTYGSPVQSIQNEFLMPQSFVSSASPPEQTLEVSEIADGKPFSISLNAVDDGELTGEMFVKFDIKDAEEYPYHENYDYYYDNNGKVWIDIKAYITPLVRETDPKTDAQAIYSFRIPYQYMCGIYKIVETVWASDQGHDSFFVEIKKGNMRIPFPAFTRAGGNIVWVKKAHDRFEFDQPTPIYKEWHDRVVSHWNAYYPPFERTRECHFPLFRSGDYKLIYSAREDLTRLSAIKIVRVFPISGIPTKLSDEAALEVALDEMEKYLRSHKAEYQYPESELSVQDSVKDDLGINSERAFWLCYGLIKDIDGNPVEGAEIKAYHTSEPDSGSDSSGPKGFYRISRNEAPWPEGHYRICARKSGVGTAYAEFDYYYNQQYPEVDLVLKMPDDQCIFMYDRE